MTDADFAFTPTTGPRDAPWYVMLACARRAGFTRKRFHLLNTMDKNNDSIPLVSLNRMRFFPG